MKLQNYLSNLVICLIYLINLVVVTLLIVFDVNADPSTDIPTSCLSCHSVHEPDELSLDERMERIGPSLYYAGNKFKQGWLEDWLQNPTRVYPAGVFFGQYVEVTDEGDYVFEEDLVEHPILDAAEAKSVASALASLKPKQHLLDGITTDGIKKISRRMGQLNFRKFKGCVSCHQDILDDGGVSGPELYTAFNRLQLTYLISYIKDPVAWEPKSLMPNQHLKEKDIEKLVGYLKTIAEEE